MKTPEPRLIYVVMTCGQKHSEAEILSAAASIRGKRQTPHAGPGRPRKINPCERCGVQLSARERQRHKCEK